MQARQIYGYHRIIFKSMLLFHEIHLKITKQKKNKPKRHHHKSYHHRHK